MQQPYPEPDAEGNFVSPSLAMIRRVWQAFHEEQATPEDVVGVLHQVATILQVELTTLQAQLDQGISQPEDPVFQKIQQAFQHHLEAVELMASDFEQFPTGLAMAQQATNDLMAAHTEAMRHIEAMGQVSCIFCSHENPRGEERCHNCGRNLPGAVEKTSFAAQNTVGLEQGGPSGAEVTENYVSVARALEAWRREELDAAGLLATLEEVEQLTRAHRQETVQHRDLIEEAPPEAREALHQGVDQTQAALEDTLAALEKMKLAFVKEDDSYLETGLHDLELAARSLVQAFHVSRAAARVS